MAKTSRGRKQWLTWNRGVPRGSPLKVDCEWRSPPRRHCARGLEAPSGEMWIHVDFWFSNVIAPFQSYCLLALIFKTLMYLVWNESLGIGMFTSQCTMGVCAAKLETTDVDSILPLRQWHRLLFQRKRVPDAIFSPNNKWVIVDTFKWLFHV